MPTFNYARARATATRLIARYGQDSTLRKMSLGADKWAPNPENSDFLITAVDLEQEVKNADGSLVGTSQRTLYVSGAAAAPVARGDRIAIGIAPADVTEAGPWHKVDRAKPLNPGGTVVMYEVKLAG